MNGHVIYLHIQQLKIVPLSKQYYAAKQGFPHISQISHWLILVAFGYSWTSTISQNGYNPTLSKLAATFQNLSSIIYVIFLASTALNGSMAEMAKKKLIN